MRTSTHMLAATGSALALAPWLRGRAAAFWLGAALTDADLYLYYVVRHRHLSPRAAARYYHTLAGRRERARKLLHSPLVSLVILASMRRAPTLAAFGAGVLLHQLMDRLGKVPYRRMRRVIELRSSGYCEACGVLQPSIALMEPRFLGAEGGREDFDPDHWRLLCRPCNEARSLWQ